MCLEQQGQLTETRSAAAGLFAAPGGLRSLALVSWVCLSACRSAVTDSTILEQKEYALVITLRHTNPPCARPSPVPHYLCTWGTSEVHLD